MDASRPRKAEATKAAARMVRPIDGKVKRKLAAGIVRWSRWKGQAKMAAGSVRWKRWKGQTRLADGMVRWIDGRVKPSWRRASSVGPMERGQTARSLALVGGRALLPQQGPANSRDGLGTARRLGPDELEPSLTLLFLDSTDKIPTSARGGTPGHSPMHPTC